MSGMELPDRLRLAWGSRSNRMLTVARLGALAGVLWGVAGTDGARARYTVGSWSARARSWTSPITPLRV